MKAQLRSSLQPETPVRARSGRCRFETQSRRYEKALVRKNISPRNTDRLRRTCVEPDLSERIKSTPPQRATKGSSTSKRRITNELMILYTIGSAQTSAEDFFGKLSDAGVTRLIDTRLHSGGQLSGFAKVPDLLYFLRRLTECAYLPMPSLAPTSAMLQSYRRRLWSWAHYADTYTRLLRERKPERDLGSSVIDNACLLCSEHSPSRCHRRLAAEYLQEVFAAQITLEVIHL